jgi:two-component system KDP operon response regulator KdpE
MSALRVTKGRVLVVEDDAAIRDFVSEALESAGYHVFEAGTLKEGLADAATRRPELVIVDLGLPDGDGIELIREMRSWSSSPIIVLSARSAEADKIQALDIGADDYLMKPFSVHELMARVRAGLRRATSVGPAKPGRVRFGDCEIDLERRLVLRAGKRVHLTQVEFKLAATLVGHGSQVFTHRQLLRVVWGPAASDHVHYLRIYMGHLRRKLEADPARPVHLLTEIGVGYRFVAEPQSMENFAAES